MMATSGAECNFVIVSARAVRLSLNRHHISGQRAGVSLNTETQQWLYVEYCEDCTGGLEFHSRVQLQRVGCVHIYAQALTLCLHISLSARLARLIVSNIFQRSQPISMFDLI